MKSKYIFVLSLFFISAPSFAENWILYGESTDGSEHYYDLDSIKRSGNTVIVWQKIIDAKAKGYQMSKGRWKINCFSEDRTLTFWAKYKEDGSVDVSQTIPSYEQIAEPTPPGSLAESLVQSICSR